MRLYLSSHRFGDRMDLLLGMVGQGGRVGVISNAADSIPRADRENYLRNIHNPAAELRAHGLDVTDLDLRDYFGRPDALEEALGRLDLVWVVGGNTFLLRRAMRQSGFDVVGKKRIAEDKLIYGGFSAGAIVACPSLKGIELMDDPNTLAEGYDPEVIRDGLGLVSFHIVPHYESDHHESEAAGRTAAWMLDQAMPYRTMGDGDVLIRDAAGIRAYERAA
jgi:dipeptidase E